VPLLAARTDVSAKVIGASIAAVLLVAVTGVVILLPRLAVGPSPTSAADRAFANLPAPWATEATDIPALVATAGPTATPAAVAVTVAPTAPPRAVAPAAAPTAAARPLKGVVALTFDAGADRGYAEDILDLLAAAHAGASFGITGEWAKHNPDLVRRMAAEGHLVINHTLDHRSFTGLSDEGAGLAAARRRAELEQADALIAPLIGHTTRPWYRLPYGDDDARVAEDVAPTGFTRKVGWTVDSGGWRGWTAADILRHCLQAAEPGAIYVLHVGEDSQDRLALGPLIAGLRERGYSFATVAELP
jgi:peptidoglycan/xylan/chitin deacetylase (PgdA/CDA1 family)